MSGMIPRTRYFHSVLGDGLIALVGLEGPLLLRLHFSGFHLLDLSGEDDLSFGGWVDAVGLIGDGEVVTDLQEVGVVDGDNASLIRLSIIGKDVHHWHGHPVLVRVSQVLNDQGNVGPL